MVKKLLLAVLLLTAQGYVYPVAADVGSGEMLQQVTLEVRNMSCGMCKYTVENALKQVEGVKNAKVDMDRKTAVVSFDPAKVDTEALTKAVSDAGYPASVLD